MLGGISISALAQDKIQKKQGEIINVKVVEVTEDYVGYRLPNDPSGPVYKLRKDAITKITYESGLVESFGGMTSPATTVQPVTDPMSGTEIYMSTNFGKNILNFDFISILYNEVGLSYERVLDNGFVGFKLPFIAGMGGGESSMIRQVANTFQTGLDVNLYPTGQGPAKYFIGPGLRFGKAYDYLNVSPYYYEPTTGQYVDVETRLNYNLLAFQVNNGIVFQPTGHFNISLIMGIGIRKLSDTSGRLSTKTENYGTFNANVAYRF